MMDDDAVVRDYNISSARDNVITINESTIYVT